MSPAAAYMEALHGMPRMWPHMATVPLLIPMLVVALMHVIRRGLVVVFMVGTLSVGVTHVVCEYTGAHSHAAV
eukprot:929895-Rhodomonas_salina.1